MANEKRRLLYEFYLLCESDKPLKSDEIALKVGISVRTFKSDINDLKSFALASGAQLYSKNGLGYWIEVNDKLVFLEVKEQLDINFNIQSFSKDEKADRSNDILRMVICNNEYIKIEDIASNLYLSASAIRQDLKKAREFLTSYHLDIDIKKNKGISIVGTELNRRLCMVELLEKHYFKAMPMYKDTNFIQYFEVGDNVSQQIRKKMLTCIRNDQFHVFDKYINRMVKYCALSYKRDKEDYKLNFSNEFIEQISQYGQLELAKKIVRELNTIEGFYLDNNEIYSICLMILMWADCDLNDTYQTWYAPINPFISKLSDEVFKYIKKHYHMDLTVLKDSDKILGSALATMCFKIVFKVDSFKYSDKSIGATSLSYCGLNVSIANDVISYINNKYNVSLKQLDMNQVAVRLQYLCDEIEFDYRPVSLVIASRNGLVGANMIKNNILKRYDKSWFKKIDVQEYFRIRNYDKYDYDYVLLNFPDYSYRYEIPYMHVSQMITHKQLDEIFDKVLIRGYNVNEILEDFNFTNIGFFNDVTFDNQSGLMNMIAYKNGKNNDAIKQLLSLENRVYCSEGKALICCSSELTNGNCFQMYNLSKKLIFNGKIIENVLFISGDFEKDLQRYKYLNYVIYALFRFNDQWETLVEKQDINYLNDVVYKCLSGYSNN